MLHDGLYEKIKRIDIHFVTLNKSWKGYIRHRESGAYELLFVREFKTDRFSGTATPYTFLGTANYVKHEGSKPMNITRNLDAPISAKFLKKTNKLVVG